MERRSLTHSKIHRLTGPFFLFLVFFLTFVASASAAAPTIESTSVTNVSTSHATLRATINPNGLLTKYKLQIDVTGNFKFNQNDGCVLHPPGIGCTQALVDGEPQPAGLNQPPESELAAGSTSQNVAAGVGTLQPGTTYYYRAIAANSNGFTYGQTQTFTTPSTTGPPTIVDQYESGVTPYDATLHARINPNGLKTYYELQIDTTGNFKFDQTSSCPLEEAPMVCLAVMEPGDPLAPGLVQPPEYTLDASSSPQNVSVNMANIGATLQPETTYHYRTIAANGEQLVEGPEKTFTTPSATGPPEVELGEAWNIKTDDATLEARVNPRGLDTTYQFFLYLPCPTPGPGEVACQGTAVLPLPGGTIPASDKSVSVSVKASDGGYELKPGTDYEWTVRAENDEGVVFAPEESFITGQRPTIQGQSVSDISETSAMLHAKITPGIQGNSWGWSGVGTYYQFQLVEDPAEYRPEIGCPDLSEFAGSSVGCVGPWIASLYGWADAAGPIQYEPTDLPFSDLGEPLASQAVSLDLSTVGRELEPATTYHYRVIAVTRLQGVDKIEWEAPPVYGPDRTFTTGPFPEAPVDPPADPLQGGNVTLQAGGTFARQTAGTISEANRGSGGKRCVRKKRNRRRAKTSRLSGNFKAVPKGTNAKRRACRAAR